MVRDMEANEYPYDQCREFAKLRQLVRVEVSEVSIPTL
jgi:hypothetical protein